MQNAAETVQHVQARNCYNLPSQNNRCSVIICLRPDTSPQTRTVCKDSQRTHSQTFPLLLSFVTSSFAFIFLLFADVFLRLWQISPLCPPSTVIQHSTLFRLLCCSPSFHSLSRLVPPCLWRRYQCFQCSCSLPSPCYYSPPSHVIEISISLPPPSVFISPSRFLAITVWVQRWC